MQKWQDISTAPKGSSAKSYRERGPEVLLTDGGSIWIGFWNGRSWDDGDFFDDLGPMTHWMPLPSLPEATRD